MDQKVINVGVLPDGSLEANQAFLANYLDAVLTAQEDDPAQSIAIVLPQAGPEQDDWRRAIARDLARSLAPARVNIVAGKDTARIDATLAYLSDAQGVTGQYCQVHEE